MVKLTGGKKEKRSEGLLVSVVNLQNKVKIDKKYVRKVAEETVSLGNRNRRKLGQGKCEVGIIFVNNSYIKRLNRKYRKVNRATDVIAFPMEQCTKFIPSIPSSSRLLGDVFISAERAKVQAKALRHSIKREIAILTIHGILHLLSYGHERRKDGRVMRNKEEEILNQIKDFKK
ncbi:MAG: rRNA maturation RNase YbeY [bacterium]